MKVNIKIITTSVLAMTLQACSSMPYDAELNMGPMEWAIYAANNQSTTKPEISGFSSNLKNNATITYNSTATLAGSMDDYCLKTGGTVTVIKSSYNGKTCYNAEGPTFSYSSYSYQYKYHLRLSVLNREKNYNIAEFFKNADKTDYPPEAAIEYKLADKKLREYVRKNPNTELENF